MRIATAQLVGISPYSQSRWYAKEVLPEGRASGARTESAKDYEARTWRSRLHTDDQGRVYVPPMSLKNALSDIARYLSVQIPGKGKATYTKHIEAGVLVIDPMYFATTVLAKDVAGEWLFVPASGKRGDGKRVEKCFPVIPAGWQGTATFHVLDDVLTEPVFEQHLREAGNFVGIGRFRPRNNGFYGRFKVESISWQNS